MADPSVKVTLRLEGENKAGKAIKEAEDQASQLAKRLTAVADKSGDGERALLGVKDILGSMGGPAQELADWAGGFEGIVKGIGGPLSIAVAGAAALAAGFYKLYQMSKEAEKARIDALVKEHESQLQNKSVLAEKLGLERDALQASKERLTAEQARSQLDEVAAQYAKESAERVRAIASDDKERVVTADALLSRLQQQALSLAAQEQFARRIAETEKVRAALQQAGTEAAELERQRIERIADVPDRLAKLESLRQERERKLAADRARLREQEAAGMGWLVQKYRDASGAVVDANAEETRKIEEFTREKTRLAREEMAIEDELIRIAKAGEQYANERAAERQKRSAAYKAQLAERERREKESDRVSKEIADRFVADIGRRIAAIKQEREFAAARDKAYADAQQEVRDAQIAAVQDPARRAEMQYLEDRRKLLEQLRQVQQDGTREARTAAAQQLAITTRIATLEAEHIRQVAEARAQARDAAVTQAGQIADATINALGMVDGAQKAAAATKAVLAVAEGLYAVATQGVAGIPQLIAGIAAGAQFALASGSSAPQVPSGVGAGGGQQAPRDLGPRMEPQRNVTINVTGAVIGTPQQVGMQVSKAAKSLQGTGYPAKAGA